jgi:hypothetical protein
LVELVHSEDRAAEDHDETASAALINSVSDTDNLVSVSLWLFLFQIVLRSACHNRTEKTGTEIFAQAFLQRTVRRGAHANQGSDVCPASTADFRPP